jgi:hypothetical protein
MDGGEESTVSARWLRLRFESEDGGLLAGRCRRSKDSAASYLGLKTQLVETQGRHFSPEQAERPAPVMIGGLSADQDCAVGGTGEVAAAGSGGLKGGAKAVPQHDPGAFIIG